MDYIACNTLDNSIIRQLEELRTLTGYEPFFAASAAGSFRHFHILLSDGKIISFLGLLPLSETSVEITGFTHPAHQGKGCFTQLLQNALRELSLTQVKEILADRRLDFPFVQSLPAYSEYLMSLSPEQFTPHSGVRSEASGSNDDNIFLKDIEIIEYCSHDNTAAEYVYVLSVNSSPAGLLKISHENASPSACLHHVQIRKSMRGHGYGKSLLEGALKIFFEENTCDVLLHVTGRNIPAVKLYENAGFQIIQSLDYFYLHPAEQ